ncbi:MAG: hypothetical protein N3A65_04390 [candidate division WOR-3 bacterium]|nr:hypothetical protein [candidate division WOR-3 bacterium]
MKETKANEELFAGMDEAAQQAKEEFDQMPDDVKKTFSQWMRKWYLKAGYRRLGRIVVAYAKAIEKG